MSAIPASHAGRCTYCANGAHSLCREASCPCRAKVEHPMRPASHRVPDMRPSSPIAPLADDDPPMGTVPDLPDFEWEEPPTRGRGPSLVPSVRPKLDRLRVRPNFAARIITFPGKTSAYQARKRLQEEVGDEFEFTSGRYEDGSAVWARYVGES